jgi:NAD(P)-dependent dehydrogenase (short-subunit alcohol dehydrogenase family)
LNALPNKRPGAIAIAVPADSSRGTEIEKLVAGVKRHTDHVDILFANAGATWGAPFDSHPEEGFQKVMDLNVKGVFVLVQKFAPLLTARASVASPSRVLINASVAGLVLGSLSENGTFGYSVSKAAAIHLARNLAVELGPRHVLTNAIAPGFFPSKMSKGLMELEGGAQALAKQSPDGKLGQAEDIAAAVVYLCSRAAQHVNGICLVVDGGSMWRASKL